MRFETLIEPKLSRCELLELLLLLSMDRQLRFEQTVPCPARRGNGIRVRGALPAPSIPVARPRVEPSGRFFREFTKGGLVKGGLASRHALQFAH